ncbi:unnamed protein product [Orchesella dallaii]|uniref:Serpin domain-containing protein n=1 Tax=Orchesella dallaii TaxID=48710 RepID=A0ABP1QQX0_9HEXA
MKVFVCSPVLLLFIFLSQTSNTFYGVEGVPEYISNFENFTDHLVHILETSEPTEHRPGVHLYTPFSIGYMLANIYESLWPVPVKEIPEAIFTLKKYVATDYAALLRLFKKRHFRISSTIFSRFGNVTKPPTFKQLLTQVISLDVHQNRTEFKESLREILGRGTKGHLEGELLPKQEAAWREIFDNSTHGVYINTLHFKSDWDRPWKEIEDRKFYDNALVPFMELKGEYPYAEADNASAVKIDLQASTKQIILFKPHDFTSVTDMRRIVREMLNNESLWRMENVTVQMPMLNVTNLSQPSDKFPFMGVMDTFCRGRYMEPSQFYYNQHPLAHANHFEFTVDSLEIASASGSLVAYQNNREFLPKPPANQSHQESGSESNVDYFDILEASEEDDERWQDYIIDARSEIPLPPLVKHFRGELRASAKNGSNEFEECDPILIHENFQEADMMGKPASTIAPSTDSEQVGNTENPMEVENNINELPDEQAGEGKMLLLDTPFSWILRDKEIGEVFYGSVSSLCQYNRAVHHIPTVPLWVLDLFKAFYWRCV